MLMNNLRNFPPVTLGIFQSTLLQEERLKLKYIQNGNSYFNPRSYKRSDIVGICLCVGYVVFQSTLLQEERRGSGSGIIYPPFISIHAPTRGATSLWMLQRNSGSISIHAPTRGATLYLLIFSFYRNFNPRSYKRSDERRGGITFEVINFNPRSYKRSDLLRHDLLWELLLFQSTLLQEERPSWQR